MLGKERIAQISALSLISVLLASVVMSGAAHPEVVSLLGLVLVGSLVVVWVLARPSTLRVPLHLFALLSFMFLGSVLQWLPLPLDFVAMISPETARQITMAYRGYELPANIGLSWRRYFVSPECSILLPCRSPLAYLICEPKKRASTA